MNSLYNCCFSKVYLPENDPEQSLQQLARMGSRDQVISAEDFELAQSIKAGSPIAKITKSCLAGVKTAVLAVVAYTVVSLYRSGIEGPSPYLAAGWGATAFALQGKHTYKKLGNQENQEIHNKIKSLEVSIYTRFDEIGKYLTKQHKQSSVYPMQARKYSSLAIGVMSNIEKINEKLGQVPHLSDSFKLKVITLLKSHCEDFQPS